MKLLACHHSFCRECITAMAKKKKEIACPICKVITHLVSGVDGLMNNFAIQSLLDAALVPFQNTISSSSSSSSSSAVNVLASTQKCEMCDCDKPKDVMYGCRDCNWLMCKSCLPLHSKIAACKSHTVLALDEFSKKRVKKCQIHTANNLDLACETCTQVICSSCALDHQGHRVTALDLAVVKKTEKLLSTVAEVQIFLDRLAEFENEKSQKLNAFKESACAARRNVNDRYEELVREAVHIRNLALAVIASQEEATLMEFDEAFGSLVALREKGLRNLNDVKAIIEAGDGADIFASCRSHMESLRQVIEKEDEVGSMKIPEKKISLTAASVKAFDEVLRSLNSAFQTDVSSVGTGGTGVITIDRGAGVIGNERIGFSPYGTAIVPPSREYSGGLLIAVDTVRHKVEIFNATTSEHYRTLGTGVAGSGADQFYNPEFAAVYLSEKLLYISDSGNNRVQVYSLVTWALVKSITSGISYPSGVAVFEGLLYVANLYSHCVKVLDAMTGDHRLTIGKERSRGSGVGQLKAPIGIAMQSQNGKTLLYVADCWNHRIQVFDASSGQHVRMIGNGDGSGPGQLNCPRDVAVATSNAKYPGGAIYVADGSGKRVQVFDSITGRCLGVLAGSEGKFSYGVSVCSDSQGRNLVFVSEYTNHNVDIILDA